MQIEIKIIPPKDIVTILPLLSKLNTKTPTNLLKERVLEMCELPNYVNQGLKTS